MAFNWQNHREDKYILEIYFEEYPGNFHRELAAHLFGVFIDSSSSAERIFENMPSEERKSLEWVDPNVNFDSPLLICDNEYEPAYENINVYNALDSEKQEHSIEFQFSRELTDKELLQIQERIASFDQLMLGEEIKTRVDSYDLILSTKQNKDDETRKVIEAARDKEIKEIKSNFKGVKPLSLKHYKHVISTESTKLVDLAL